MKKSSGLMLFVLTLVAIIMSKNTVVNSTILLKLSIEKMSREADLIAIGKIVDVKSIWADDQSTIYTFAKFKVTRCIAGRCGKTIKLKHRGGTVGDVTIYIPSMPRFVKGQQLLLFLRKDPEGQEGYYSVFGMVQGMFIIERNKKDGKVYAIQNLEGASLADFDSSGLIRPVECSKAIKMKLQDIISKIKEARQGAKNSENTASGTYQN